MYLKCDRCEEKRSVRTMLYDGDDGYKHLGVLCDQCRNKLLVAHKL